MSVTFKNTILRSWNPTDIEEAKLSVDSSDASTVTKDGSNNVSAWDDKSGGGWSLTQITEAQQPLYIIGGQNGLNIMDFDEEKLVLTSDLFSFAGDFTIIIAFKAEDVSTGYIVNKAGSDANKDYFLEVNRCAVFDAAGDGFFDTNFVAPTVNVPSIISLMWNESTHDIQSALNGVLHTAVNHPTATNRGTTADLEIGNRGVSADAFNGKLFEVHIYGKVLSTKERELAEAYLTTKWGI